MTHRIMTILLVDGSDDHASVVAQAIDAGGFAGRLIHRRQPTDALAYLTSLGHEERGPDMVVLDLDLPGSSGLELVRHLRSHPRTVGCPAIVLSSSGDTADIERAYRIGANSYIVKPTKLNDFVIKLAEMTMYWRMTAEVPQPVDTAAK
jgi:DNA-binding response OmpR family regulator